MADLPIGQDTRVRDGLLHLGPREHGVGAPPGVLVGHRPGAQPRSISEWAVALDVRVHLLDEAAVRAALSGGHGAVKK